MKITIIGAGAMGLLYASMLAKQNEVILIDKNQALIDVINGNGYTVCEPDGSESHHTAHIYSTADGIGVCDLVIVFVKDIFTQSAIRDNMSLIGKDTIVLSLQNGLGNEEIITQYVSRDRLILGTSKHNSVVKDLGKIYHSGAGVTNIGSVSGNTAIAKTICDNFAGCGIETQLCEEVKRLLWEKLFVNMTINSVSALLGCNIGFLADNDYTLDLMHSLISEAVAVAKAEGLDFDTETIYSNLVAVCHTLSTGKASMCQDMENKRRTEIDFINGAVVRGGEAHDIPTPCHKTIVRLIHSKELLYK